MRFPLFDARFPCSTAGVDAVFPPRNGPPFFGLRPLPNFGGYRMKKRRSHTPQSPTFRIKMFPFSLFIRTLSYIIIEIPGTRFSSVDFPTLIRIRIVA